ncbi:MAG: hypothetical protein JNJ59_22230 [Deltaproteobacteria bacterium]|nr:hypothetical protein [Deltaproteobacteria bacterium]
MTPHGQPVRVRPVDGVRSPRGLVAMIVAVLAVSACHDPGEEALDRALRGVDSLIALAERRARGELDEAGLIAALRAWERTEASEIRTLAEDAGRALGPARREVLAKRWREASELLGKRLSPGALPTLEIPTAPPGK